MKRALLLLVAACATSTAARASDVLFESSTENSTAGWAPVAEPLAHALIASGDATDRQLVDDTIREDGLPPGDAQFFRMKPIRVALAGRP